MANLFLLVIFLVVANQCSANYSSKYQLNNDIASITIASNDYGNIVHNKPSFVLDPTSVTDIISLMRNSRPWTKIAARGNGHSTHGQDMTLGGVVVNMTALSRGRDRITIGRGSTYVDVGAEQLWVDVLRSTLKSGYAPVSWTDYLNLTVGGTLSDAGISGHSFLHGPQISNVLELDVVTGKAEFITCSPRKNSELFFAVLGGLGQFGIITRARIALDRAPKTAVWARFIYSDFTNFTKDQEHLISAGVGASYVEGAIIVNSSAIDQWNSSIFSIPDCTPAMIDALLEKHHVLYSIELTKYYDNQTVDTMDEDFYKMLENLNFIEELCFVTQVPYFDFLNRYGNVDTPEMGSNLYHPWLHIFVPKSRIHDFNELVLAGMLPRLSWTSYPILFYPLNKNKWNDAMSAVTPDLTAADNGVFYALVLQHSVSEDKYQSMEDFNIEIQKVCHDSGIRVKQYLPHYKTNLGWRYQFGSKWGRLQSRKQMFDPYHKLSPGQGIVY